MSFRSHDFGKNLFTSCDDWKRVRGGNSFSEIKCLDNNALKNIDGNFVQIKLKLCNFFFWGFMNFLMSWKLRILQPKIKINSCKLRRQKCYECIDPVLSCIVQRESKTINKMTMTFSRSVKSCWK